MTRDLTRLISPKAVAVVGGRWADFVHDSCKGFGFEGSIFRVHPGKAAAGVEGFWPSLASLPVLPDCTFLGVNPEATIDAISELRQMGAGGAICLASGFADTLSEDAGGLQGELLQAAGDFPFLEPNCLGFVNFFDRVSVFPEPAIYRPVDRGVGIISQSGTVACNILFADRALPLGLVLSVGQSVLSHVVRVGSRRS